MKRRLASVLRRFANWLDESERMTKGEKTLRFCDLLSRQELSPAEKAELADLVAKMDGDIIFMDGGK